MLSAEDGNRPSDHGLQPAARWRISAAKQRRRKPRPGIDIIDRMCLEQDRFDRVAAIRQKAETAWIEAHFDKGPHVAKDYNPVRAYDQEVPSTHREKK